jgi:threonine/homoserine/homoserine lactone efflux protein
MAGIIQIPLLALGLASIINASPIAHEILRWGGAFYLTYLGARHLIGSLTTAEGEQLYATQVSTGAAFRQGVISNLTNPATLAFMLALLPQFADPSAGSVATQLIVLGITMKATGLIILGSVAVAAGSVGGLISRRRSLIVWQERLAGTAMIGLACYLLSAGSLRAR